MVMITHSMVTAKMPGIANGSVTPRKVLKAEAPDVRLASSRAPSILRSTGISSRKKKVVPASPWTRIIPGNEKGLMGPVSQKGSTSRII